MKLKIAKDCSDFIKSSNGIPLIRMLPAKGKAMRQVKIRKKKTVSPFDATFNAVFIDHPDIRQRCIFTNGDHTESDDPLLDAFYIFPKNGFKFMYSMTVKDSSQQYSSTVDKLKKVMDVDNTTSIISNILEFDYKNDKLHSALEIGCEIIIFGCPSYYAIKCVSIKSYSTLFSL